MSDPRTPRTPAPPARGGFNPWPWVPAAILLIVVLANAWLIHAARSTGDGLLYEDWYERGQRASLEAARARAEAEARADAAPDARDRHSWE